MDKNIISRDSPCVSIIIPTFNRASFISQSIRSVLSQTFTDFEIIIIDDASTDNTLEVVEPFLYSSSVVFIQNLENKGISRNRNYGISIAKGKYIAMLDSDDVWIDINKLSSQVSYLEHNIDCNVVGTWMVQIDELGNPLKLITFAQSDANIRKSILYRNHIAQSSVLFRKVAAQVVGGYDDALATMEDHDLWLRMGINGQFAVLPIYALGYRLHKSNITRSQMTRVALDEITVVWRHRYHYQGILTAVLVGNVRLIKSMLF